MTTLEKIKKDLMQARLSRSNTSFLSFLVSECESVGKNNGNRQSNEVEVQSVIRKMIESNKKSLGGTMDESLNQEIEYLESLRPKMVSQEDLFSFITINCRGMSIGDAMKEIKDKFGASVDMKLASSLVRAQL
jgi:uncharacterized protein YqeY